MTVRIATRSSALARAQAAWIGARLGGFELVVVTTSGDRWSGPLPESGAKGLFVREVEEALLSGAADVAVHSMKDLPTGRRPGLALAAVPPREDPADVFCGRRGVRFASLPAGARIGTGSPRRAAQLRERRPDLRYEEIRGNVETRLRKVEEGAYDGTVLAAAGLRRLGLSDRATERFDPAEVLPAPGQGALAVQTRAGEEARAAALDDAATRAATAAERAFLEALGGGCRVPVGAYARLDGTDLVLSGVVAGAEAGGGPPVRADLRGPAADPEGLGRRLADLFRARGAA